MPTSTATSADMTSTDIEARLGPALVEFATNRAFPEEEAISAAYVPDSALPAALRALNDATISLETEIRQISRESAPDVESWITHAQKLQDDISESRKLASNIVRQAEADEERLEKFEDAKFRVEFLQKEATFEARLYEALRAIQLASDTLDRVEQLGGEQKLTEALETLEKARTLILEIPTTKSVAAVKLLHTRWVGLKSSIHELFVQVWNALVHFDSEERALVIHKVLESEDTSLEQALVGLQEYDKVEEIGKELWRNLNQVVIQPRTDLRRGELLKVVVQNNCLRLGPLLTELTIKSLLLELGNVISFLCENLPSELIPALSDAMMPALFDRVKDLWLDAAVPASLDEISGYQETLACVNEFAKNLDSLNWPGAQRFHEWVKGAPRVWLNKRRETALDWTRGQLALGLGIPHPAKRVETQVVGREDQVHTSPTADKGVDDWDAGWDDEGHQGRASQNPALAKEAEKEAVFSQLVSPEPEQDDAADAWGWGAEDDVAEPEESHEATSNGDQPSVPNKEEKVSPNFREVTLTEDYWTSTLPRPVLQAVVEIFNDGAILSKSESEHNPVSTAAPGLFTLPTQVLAMYRAVSPCYYAEDPSGNMCLYNDAMWLCDQLRTSATEWSKRTDLSPRAHGMVKLVPEIKALDSFGKRAYTAELNLQRTLLNDLLGGAQNLFQQDHTLINNLAFSIESTIQHIRDRHTLWKQILAPSVLASATGSLVNAVASKLIADVLDLPDISVDDAERTARLIDKVTVLDDLFLPEVTPRPAVPRNPSSRGASLPDGALDNGHGPNPNDLEQQPDERIPMTPRFADKWLKLKFLSEVLQSNLKDIRFFWFESDLSLYFTKEEVVDLIKLSFENNAQVRQVVREIRESGKGQ